MSSAKLEEITCPCGEVFEAELWNAINTRDNPELKEALISGEVNVVSCPSCGQIFYAEHFVLYHDPDSEILAFVYPSSFASHASHWHAKMKSDFSRAMDELHLDKRIPYEPVLLFGLECLVDMIHEDDAESDEVSILEYSAKDLGLSLIQIHPALARKIHVPRTLPKLRLKNKSLREEIIAGLKLLIGYNQNLLRFKNFLHHIEHSTKWELDKELSK